MPSIARIRQETATLWRSSSSSSGMGFSPARSVTAAEVVGGRDRGWRRPDHEGDLVVRVEIDRIWAAVHRLAVDVDRNRRGRSAVGGDAVCIVVEAPLGQELAEVEAHLPRAL